MAKPSNILQERTTLRTWLLAIVVIIVGGGLIYLSAIQSLWTDREPWQTVVRTLGSVLIVTVAVGILWQLFVRRAFLEEVLGRIKIAQELNSAGIVGFTDSFYAEPDWASLFQGVKRLDIFFAYGRTWRNVHRRELEELAKRTDAQIRVILPDIDDHLTISDLARRFNCTAESIKTLIAEAKDDFTRLKTIGGNTGAKIDIWALPAPPLFTFYRFDDSFVLTLYSHRRERSPVPTFVVKRGGKLYDILFNELDAMIRPPNNLARHID